MKRVLKDIVARLNKSHHPSQNDNKLTKKISRKYPWGQIDSIEIEQSGLLRIKGFLIDNISDLTGLRDRVNGREIVSLNSYTTYSPEEAKTFSSHTPFCGLVIEYLLHPVANQEITNIDIRFN